MQKPSPGAVNGEGLGALADTFSICTCSCIGSGIVHAPRRNRGQHRGGSASMPGLRDLASPWQKEDP